MVSTAAANDQLHYEMEHKRPPCLRAGTLALYSKSRLLHARLPVQLAIENELVGDWNRSMYDRSIAWAG